MIRRGWTALIVTAMGLGLFAAHSSVRVHADNAPRITNIGVAVDGSGHVSYGMCVVAAAPPSSGTVIVEGPITSTAQLGASFTYNDLSCGDYNGTAYFMRATFSPPLAAGSYTFVAAEADEPDGSFATLGRYDGFTSNFAGDEVWNSCSVDFDTGTPSTLRNCSPLHNTGGVVGDLTSVIVPGPTPTPTHVPTATKAPTSTPVPTATPTQSGNGTSPADMSTPTGTSGASGTAPIGIAAPTNTPVTIVVLSTGPSNMVSAATATPTATSHPSSLLRRPVGRPQRHTQPSSRTTHSRAMHSRATHSRATHSRATHSRATHSRATHSRATHSRATHSRATHSRATHSSGPALRVTVLEPLVQPGAAEHLTVSYVADALVQANVAFPGVRPFSLHGRTGIHGRLVLSVTVPRTIKLSHGRASALVAISAVSNKGRARVTRVLRISDMVVRVAVSSIVSCVQTQTVRLAYHPNASLRVVLQFPHGRHLTFRTRTDRHGHAMVRVSVTYVHADSPVRIGVQASDATKGAQRMESTAVSVTLPTACQKAPAPIVTIGD